MIFYFSGTGNTRWVAQALADATGERLVEINNVKPGKCPYDLAEDERIGFCFPVHGWQPPALVRQFVANLRFAGAGGHFCFAVCTCGDNIGDTMEIFNHDLIHIGLHADSVFSVTMPNTYVALPFMDTDPPHVEDAKVAAARDTVAKIAMAVKNRQRGLCKTVKGPAPFILSYVIGQFFNRVMVSDGRFSVDGDRCIRCGKCAAACPTGNIALPSGQTPQWMHTGKCTSCLACYHHCPSHAIKLGRTTRHKGQYFFGRAEKNAEKHNERGSRPKTMNG